MAKWREVSADLRRRVLAGEFPIGSPLPTINELQAHYEVPSLNTIRQAQSPLVDEGLLERRPGIGVYVSSTTPRPAGREEMLAEFRTARAAIDRAIALLERGNFA